MEEAGKRNRQLQGVTAIFPILLPLLKRRGWINPSQKKERLLLMDK
jgi:hypothetical protein